MKIDIYPLRNKIQNYPWGSRENISKLLGLKTPSEKPEAELWMGAHPKAPSEVLIDGKPLSLTDWIASNPLEILGETVAKRYQNTLPFLFKILAAERPLSIQVHPSRHQAKVGFQKEEEAGIPYDSPLRNYRDQNHKPELLCALSTFWILQGFRPPAEILYRFEELQLSNLKEQFQLYLRKAPSEEEALKDFFAWLMSLPPAQQIKLVRQAIENAIPLEDRGYTYRWLLKINQYYPGDVGVLSPLFLNLIELRPGEAIYQRSGVIHAYLKGFGLELMANSDNVLRAGLTSKHVDLPELLKTAKFTPTVPQRIVPRPISSKEIVYFTPAPEFALYRINLNGQTPYQSAINRNVEILICTEGEAELKNLTTGLTYTVSQGSSFIVPAAVESYTIDGKGVIFRATVPPFSS